MKTMKKTLLVFIVSGCLCFFSAFSALAANAALDFSKMADMSDFDPNHVVQPKGDVVKIGMLAIFSGPGAGVGEFFWLTLNWVAHDLNKRGGILVDGKRKKIVFIKGDTKGKPADTKKAVEKLILKDKVDVLWAAGGSHLCAIISQVAKRYKIIFESTGSSDYLMDSKHFNRYTFETIPRNSTWGQAGAYYYGRIRNKEKKFYLLNQDYVTGHSLAEKFKKGLKKYFPQAEIVGEDYHPLFAKDFAPYVTKIKGSGAEVIFTGDWIPDSANLLKACRDMGVNLPILNVYLDDPNVLNAVGIEGSKGLVNLNHCMGDLRNPDRRKLEQTWNNLWKNKWQKPYNTWMYKWPNDTFAQHIRDTYWLMSVIERAGSTDPEKIIKVWEGDTYQTPWGVLKMRADDHTVIQDMYVSEYVPPDQQKLSMTIPPYYWFKGSCYIGKIVTIPAKYCIPTLDPKLKGRARK